MGFVPLIPVTTQYMTRSVIYLVNSFKIKVLKSVTDGKYQMDQSARDVKLPYLSFSYLTNVWY